MSYINQEVLKGFYSNDHWLTKAEGIAEMTDLIDQIDSEIKTKTGIDTPATPDVANGLLRNIACAFFVYYSMGKQGSVDDNERIYRQKMYDDAQRKLNKIASGETSIKDSEGNILNNPTSASTFNSQSRIEQL